MKKILLPLALLSFAAVSGCVSVKMPEASARQTKTFDFRIDNPQKSFPDTVSVDAFDSNSAAKNKMQIRNGLEVRTDEFSKWAQPPAVMMTHLFRAHAAPPHDAPLELKGNVINFLYEENTRQVAVDISYILVEKSTGKILWSETLLSHTQVNGDGTPEEIAGAMEKAAFAQLDMAAHKISEILKKIQKEGNNSKK